MQIRKIHINIFCIYYFYIFCWILSTQLETRKIDFHKTCEKNLPKVNFWSYKFGCRTFFTRIVRFALHKYLANWCVPFTRFFTQISPREIVPWPFCDLSSSHNDRCVMCDFFSQKHFLTAQCMGQQVVWPSSGLVACISIFTT